MVFPLDITPSWFLQISVFFELIITVISAGVTYAAFRVYSLCKEREIKLFGIGFLLMTLSFIPWSILNLMFLSVLDEGKTEFLFIAKLAAGMIWSYFILFLLGLANLAFMTIKVKGKRAYLLISVLSILPLFIAFTSDLARAFYITSLVLLFFITAYYGAAFFAWRKTKRLISFIAFFLILVAKAATLFTSKSYFNYIAANIAEVVAFLLLLLNLVFITKWSKNETG